MNLPGPHSLQLHVFAVCALAGMALGIAFDLYRAARGTIGPGPVLTAVGDVVFVALAAVGIASTLAIAAAGELRLYALVALAAGVAAYFGLASPVVLPPARAVWRLAFRLLKPLATWARWLGRTATALGRRLWPVEPDPDTEDS